MALLERIIHQAYEGGQHPIITEDPDNTNGAFFVLQIPTPELLGFERRNSMDAIIKEAQQLDPLTVITLNESTELVVGTTFNASPHSPFFVPKESFNQVWQIEPQQQEQDLPDYVPLHHVIWVTIRQLQPDGSYVYTQVDSYDLVGARAETLNTLIPGVNNDQIQTALPTAYEDIAKRAHRSAAALSTLYNELVRPQLNIQLASKLFQLGCATTELELFPKRQHAFLAEGIGQSEHIEIGTPFNVQGFGRGPQSVKNKHVQLALYVSIEEIEQIIETVNTANPFVSKLEILQAVLNTLQTDETDPIYPIRGSLTLRPIEQLRDDQILKHVDPYGFIATEVLDPVVKSWLNAHFAQLDPNIQVRKFEDVSSRDQLTQRFATGWEIEIPKTMLAQGLALTGEFESQMYSFWKEIIKQYEQWYRTGSDEELKTYIDTLPIEDPRDKIYLLRLIKIVQPTEEQLQEWNMMRKQELILTYEGQDTNPATQVAISLKQQVLPEYNQGYNLPNVPGLGFSVKINGVDTVLLRIRPILDLNGLAENISSLVLARKTY